jgi:hypothetical protein
MTKQIFRDLLDEAASVLEKLEGSFDQLYSLASNDEERKMIVNMLISARDAYFKAQREALEDNHGYIQSLMSDLKKTNTQIEQELTNITNFTATVSLFGEAIKLISTIIVLAAI